MSADRIITVGGTGGFKPYEVVIGAGALLRSGERLKTAIGRDRCVVVADETVRGLYGATLTAVLAEAGVRAEIIAVPAGERSKSFTELERVLDAFGTLRLDRKDCVVSLGGGVVGDLAGLAAALWMRGIGVIHIPTSLLAQVDSSVGGKTAIDTPRGKNLVGVFHQPRLVVADTGLLATLPERQLRSGWAEVIKHGLICDPDFFGWLEGEGAVGARGDVAALARAVERSVEIKATVVAEDEKEAGRRALLNLGHTFGHALEAELDFDEATMSHGEAVAIGCALAFRLSVRMGLASDDDASRAEAVLAAAGLPTRLDRRCFKATRLVERMLSDKKAEAGRLTLVLARSIGQAFVARQVDAATVEAFLKEEGAD